MTRRRIELNVDVPLWDGTVFHAWIRIVRRPTLTWSRTRRPSCSHNNSMGFMSGFCWPFDPCYPVLLQESIHDSGTMRASVVILEDEVTMAEPLGDGHWARLVDERPRRCSDGYSVQFPTLHSE